MAGTLRGLLRVALVALLLAGAVSACGDDAGQLDRVAPDRPPLDAIGGPDLRIGPVSLDGGTAEVEVRPGESALLVWVRGADADAEIVLDDVVGPDGVSRLDAIVDPMGLGEHAVVLPAEGASVGPATGPWALRWSGDGLVEAGFAARSGDAGADLAADLQLVDATSSGVDDDDRADVDDNIRAAASALLGGTGLALGRIGWVDAPATITSEFAELTLPSEGEDEAMRALCAAATTLQPVRAVTLVIVDRIVDPELDEDGETEGNAAAIPGAILVPGAWTGCVAVAAEGERGLADRASVIWHEVGHLLGLPHTSEAKGDGFDLFDDTPECTLELDADDDGHLDEDECRHHGGGNFMFHDTDSLGISAEQVAVLRSHPVFRLAA